MKTVALVTHSLDGGVWTVTRFLREVMDRSNRFRPAIIFVATSSRDSASVRLVSPSTWLKGPRITIRHKDGLAYQHAGAALVEFEFQRYRPRRSLSILLDSFDLVQVVAGTPAWAWIAKDVRRPTCLFAATTIEVERCAVLRSTKGWRQKWLNRMTQINARIEQQALTHVDAVFAESTYTYDNLKLMLAPNRLYLAPPGVDTDFYHPAARQRVADPYVLSVGRFGDPRKNTKLLFEAYAHLRKQLPSAPKLVLAGQTVPVESDRRYALDLGLKNSIEILPDVTAEQLRGLYRGASLFVLSSDEEGLGMVILEAMACGLPVVSTDCGGPRMIVSEGETGLLTPVGDAVALSNAMLTLLENADLRQMMGQNGRRLVEQRFSLMRAGQVYLNKYSELLSKNHVRD